MARLLLIEDEDVIRGALKRQLERRGYRVQEAASIPDAEKLGPLEAHDVVISDLRLPGPPGTDLLPRLKGRTPVIIMTSYANVESAVETLRMGAVDYLAKPFEPEQLVSAIERLLNHKPAAPAQVQTVGPDSIEQQILGKSSVINNVFVRLRKIAPVESTALIQGESGTGKELIARAIHRLSRRANQPMISVNCASIPESLIESELFGHVKGAFTGASSNRSGLMEAANGGTLFLDEIGELPLEAQAQLLRVIQEGEIRPVGSVETRHVNVRLIAATHRDLMALSEEGQFRKDLYYRLNVMNIMLPPLRERGDDVILLAEHFLGVFCNKYQLGRKAFSEEARDALRNHLWPGNIRELENSVERAVVLAESEIISAASLDLQSGATNEAVPAGQADISPASGLRGGDALSLKEYFIDYVLRHQAVMNESELAQQLGISRKCLWERRQRFGIPRPK
jgi:DNA-binding NtrC family response regulator